MRILSIACLILSASLLIPGLAGAGAYEDAVKAYEQSDYCAALPLFVEAGKNGNAEAQFYVGWIHWEGLCSKQDIDTALLWYTMASENGNAKAQYNLGMVYYYSNDYPRALNLLELSANQGIAVAQHNLGTMYNEGKGTEIDHVKSFHWCKEAAEQGFSVAQHDLGVKYATGNGVPQDYVQAHMWFNLAAAQGDTDSVYAREGIAEEMTPSQVEEAQRLAREWMQSHQ